MYYVHELQRENVFFETKKEALEFAKERIKDLLESAKQRGYKIFKKGSIDRDGDCILLVGSKWSYSWWSRLVIGKA